MVIEGAYRAFDEIPFKIHGTWKVMLIACAQHSQTHNVYELFKQMKS